MKLKADSAKISLSAAWSLIKSVAQAETISLAAKAAYIRLVSEVGIFLIWLKKEDRASFTDHASIDVAKVSRDAFAVVDEYVASFGKDRQDSAGVSDEIHADISKIITDLAGVLEQHAIAVHKPLEDQLATIEDLAKVVFKKAATDYAALSDQIDTKAVGKGLADPIGVSDLVAASMDKGIVDAAGVTDQAAAYLVKYLHDTVTVTDDLDGSASILDDQEITFFKVLGDVSGVSDLFERVVAYVRRFDDTASLMDQAALDISKSISEGASVFDASMAFLDKRVADVAGVSDSKALSLAKQANDAAGFSDVKQVQVGKGTQDAAGVGDSGSLRMQGYCEFSYFAEDYVGESRTF